MFKWEKIFIPLFSEKGEMLEALNKYTEFLFDYIGEDMTVYVVINQIQRDH